jgi:hypothetical protein
MPYLLTFFRDTLLIDLKMRASIPIATAATRIPPKTSIKKWPPWETHETNNKIFNIKIGMKITFCSFRKI